MLDRNDATGATDEDNAPPTSRKDISAVAVLGVRCAVAVKKHILAVSWPV
jgi:hypothetical protein